MFIKKIFFLFVFLAALIEACFSQWSTDPAQNLRVTTIGLSPKMVSDGAGGAYILYKEMPLDLVHLYVQRLDKYGYRKFPGNGVMVSDSSHYQGHIYFIINDQKGGTIIAFTDEYFLDEFGNIAVSIFVQRIDSVGNKLWGDAGIAVDLYEQAELMPVSLTADGKGGCYLFWGIRHDRNNKELRVQHLDSAGNFLWDSSGVLITDEFVSYNYPIECLSVVDDVGGTIFHYYDSTGAKLQRMDSEGNFLWGEGIKPFSSEFWWANMKEDGSKGVIIAGSYETFYNEITELWNHNIGAQRIDKDGNILWGENGVILKDSVDHRTWPELCGDEIDNYYITWRDSRSGDRDIYIQKLNQYGQPNWKMDGIHLGFVKFGGEAGMSPDNLGGVIINWHYKTLTEDAVYAQYINSSGEKIWSPDILISSRDKIYDFQSIFTNSVGIIGCWYETPPEIGIHAQQVSANGNLGEVLITNIENKYLHEKRKATFLYPNYPNPFNASTSLSFFLQRPNHVHLKIYNARGQLVRTIASGLFSAGHHTLEWDGKNAGGVALASGVYFCRFTADSKSYSQKILLLK